MKTYTEGYELAKNDVKRFGSLHAMDKAETLTGEFSDGYETGITDSFRPLDSN